MTLENLAALSQLESNMKQHVQPPYDDWNPTIGADRRYARWVIQSGTGSGRWSYTTHAEKPDLDSIRLDDYIPTEVRCYGEKWEVEWCAVQQTSTDSARPGVEDEPPSADEVDSAQGVGA